ncbi:hypothetical protein ACFOND_08470 [Reinekea marina]|uniref:Spy/CpxP family protein refolding chaperone n=2 Tax=Reinekea marina TaxID=1310421 RepID=A0ABV7WUA2_9GAMM
MTKKLLAGLLTVTMLTTAGLSMANSGSADQNGDKRAKHSQMLGKTVKLDYIFGQLNLTEETQASVTEVLKTFQESQRELMKAQREAMKESDSKQSQEEMAALREAKKAELRIALTDQLNTVLSPEQSEALVDYLEAHSNPAKFAKQRHKKQ